MASGYEKINKIKSKLRYPMTVTMLAKAMDCGPRTIFRHLDALQQENCGLHKYKKDGETYVPDTEPVATYFVKNSDDTAAKLEQIVTDPGIGEINDDLLFKGWSMEDRKNYQNVFYTEDYVGKDYTTVSEVFTVEGIREFLLTDVVGSIKEGDVIDIYAAIFKYYNVTFFGNKADGEPKWDVSLGTDTVLLRPDDTEAPYYIDMAFSPTANQNFKGWIPTAEPIELKDGNDQVVSTIPATKANISTPIQDVYPNKTAITITGDVVFGVDAPTGAWLVYNANGKGGTYNAPQFYLPNEPTAPGENATPENMERIGYSFGGWYYDADCTEPFSFGGTLVDNTNIYAKWIPVETAPYTIVFWTQNADRTGYDMAGSYRGENGQVGQNIPINLVDNGDEDYVSGVGNGNGHYTGFTVKEEDRNQQVKITPEGDAVLNLHFDRIVYELRFYVYRQEGNDANSYSYAQNSNRGRNVWGIATWYNNTSLGNMPTLDSTRYSIQRADTAIDGYYGYYFVLQAYYGEDISSKWPQYSEIVGPQNNRDPVSFIMMNGTGLKGNSTTDNGYGDGRDTIKGLITRMDEKILGLTNDADGNYLIIRFNTFNSWRYHIFYEQVPGEDYTGKTTYTYNGKDYYEDHVVTSRSSNQNVGEQNPPQYDGFEQTGNSNQTGQTGGTNGNNARWTTNEGGATLYHTRYYYDRKVYKISYMDGEYVTGRGVHIQNNAQNPLNPKESAEIQQGAVIPDDVGKNYVPAPPAGAEGYVFDGWYLDEACEGEPYVFTTMPVGGITVHAKWRQVEYRVFLHPNATIERTVNGETVIEDDLSLSWGDEEVEQESDKVSMCFRVAWGDKVSLPYGTRKGYEFIGWTTSDGGNYMPGT